MKRKYILYIETLDHSGASYEVELTQPERQELEMFLAGLDLETWFLDEPDGVDLDALAIYPKIEEFLHG